MKAIVYTEYGSPDVMQLKEIEKPVPGDNEVLVKVHAASINSWDYDRLRGKPFINRIIGGLFKPEYTIIGCDIAGVVEATGRRVKHFIPGDEVLGDLSGCGWGGFARYVCANKNALRPKPMKMSFEEAAAVPQAAALAIQGLCHMGKIREGQKVLINGAGGGVGTFGIQIAKSYGAEVTAVDSEVKLEAMKSLGADHVIDYRKTDYTDSGKQYDMIFDNVVTRSIFRYSRSLKPGGRLVMVGGSMTRVFQILFLGPLFSIIVKKKIKILAHKPNKGLDMLKELFEAGRVVPFIDSRYPLSEVPEALRHFGEGKFKGKIVITME